MLKETGNYYAVTVMPCKFQQGIAEFINEYLLGEFSL